MASRSPASMRAFVRRQTRLQPVPDVPGLRIHIAEDVTLIWNWVGAFFSGEDPPMPYWAFTWSGGLAIARHLLAHPEEVAGKSVMDIGSGSGLCAIVAAQQGAESVFAVDIDPLAEAAVAVNSRANDVRVKFSRADILDDPPPQVDLILAGDVSYEERMASRMLSWLRSAAENGTRVLMGDPGRRYTPSGLEPVATYEVHTSREVENLELTKSTVYTIPPSPGKVMPNISGGSGEIS